MTNESDGNSNPRPKRTPPVIDAEAKDVTEPSSARSEPREEQKQTNKSEEVRQPSQQPAKRFDFMTMLPIFAIALVSGVSAGLFGAWMFSGSAPQGDTSSLNNSIAQLSSRLTQQESKTAPVPDLSPLNERSAKLETATGELRGELAEVKKLVEAQGNAPTVAEVNSINRRLAQIEEKVGALAAVPKPDQKSEVQPTEVIALGALRDAIASGSPFTNEMSAVRAILKERASSIASLEKYSQSGLPTVAALAKRFEPIAGKLANTQPASPDSGVFTRLWNNAGKLVEVRPIGEPQGSDAGSVVARMETKLARGDLASALEESKSLPQQARDQAKDWFEAAERRRDADVAIKTLINAALSALSVERSKQ